MVRCLLLAAGEHERQDDDLLSRPRTRPASAGAEFVNQEVVVDGPLVTVRGWPDNGPWMREFVRLVKARKRSEVVSERCIRSGGHPPMTRDQRRN